MAILPWDNWVYHTDYLQHEVNELHKDALVAQQVIQGDIIAFNKDLKSYQEIFAANATLLILIQTVTFSDEKFSDYNVAVSALPPPKPGVVPLEIGQIISEFAGGLMMLRGICQLGRIAKSCFGKDVPEAAQESSAEELGEVGSEAGVSTSADAGAELTSEEVGEGVTEAAAETAAEGVSFAGLSSTGVGILLAVGIDAAFGLIDGAKEKKQLDKAIDKLRKAVGKSAMYIRVLQHKHQLLEERTMHEEDRFVRLVDALAEVTNTPPKVRPDLEPGRASPSMFIAEMTKAVQQYGTFVNLRNAWANYARRHPNPSKDAFLDAFMEFANVNVKHDEMSKYFDVLAKFSDSMSQGRKNAMAMA